MLKTAILTIPLKLYKGREGHMELRFDNGVISLNNVPRVLEPACEGNLAFAHRIFSVKFPHIEVTELTGVWV